MENLDRRAKYLLTRLSGGMTWMCHLGMTGRWTLLDANSTEADDGPHDWVVLHLDDGGKAVFTDHRRFGFMDTIRNRQTESEQVPS